MIRGVARQMAARSESRACEDSRHRLARAASSFTPTRLTVHVSPNERTKSTRDRRLGWRTQGKFERDREPAPWRVLEEDLAAQELRETGGHRETQPRVQLSAAEPFEGREDCFSLRRGHAGAAVGDEHLDELPDHARPDGDRLVDWSEPTGVADDVGDDPLHQDRIRE